jgi:hypothetical protein
VCELVLWETSTCERQASEQVEVDGFPGPSTTIAIGVRIASARQFHKNLVWGRLRASKVGVCQRKGSDASLPLRGFRTRHWNVGRGSCASLRGASRMWFASTCAIAISLLLGCAARSRPEAPAALRVPRVPLPLSPPRQDVGPRRRRSTTAHFRFPSRQTLINFRPLLVTR